MFNLVATSGGFDPIHMGHINYLKEARLLGDALIVILNSDNFLRMKKGYRCFDIVERRNILLSFPFVDSVFDAIDTDMTVNKSLALLAPNIFAKGGDRGLGNVPEENICKALGIRIVYGVGGSNKTNSSSRVIEDVIAQLRSNHA